MSKLFKFYRSDGAMFHADIQAIQHALMAAHPGLPLPAYSPNAITHLVLVAGIEAKWDELGILGRPACSGSAAPALDGGER